MTSHPVNMKSSEGKGGGGNHIPKFFSKSEEK